MSSTVPFDLGLEDWKQGPATFSVEVKDSQYFQVYRLCGLYIYQLWCCSTKAGNGNMQINGQTCSTKILFMRPCGVLDLEYRVKIADSGLRESPGIDSQKEHFWKKGDYKFVEKLHGVIMRRQVLCEASFQFIQWKWQPMSLQKEAEPRGKRPLYYSLMSCCILAVCLRMGWKAWGKFNNNVSAGFTRTRVVVWGEKGKINSGDNLELRSRE